MILPILGILVLAWMFVTFRARQRTRFCRWREDRRRDTAEGRYFTCMTCGAETFSRNDRPPQVCLNPKGRPP